MYYLPVYHMFLFLAFLCISHAEVVYYNTSSPCGSGCNFSDAAIWVGGAVPTAPHSAYIGSAVRAELVVDASVLLGNFTLCGEVTLVVLVGGSLNVTGTEFSYFYFPSSLNISGGQVEVGGSLQGNGSLNVLDHGLFTTALLSGSTITVINSTIHSIQMTSNLLFALFSNITTGLITSYEISFFGATVHVGAVFCTLLDSFGSSYDRDTDLHIYGHGLISAQNMTINAIYMRGQVNIVFSAVFISKVMLLPPSSLSLISSLSFISSSATLSFPYQDQGGEGTLVVENSNVTVMGGSVQNVEYSGNSVMNFTTGDPLYDWTFSVVNIQQLNSGFATIFVNTTFYLLGDATSLSASIFVGPGGTLSILGVLQLAPAVSMFAPISGPGMLEVISGFLDCSNQTLNLGNVFLNDGEISANTFMVERLQVSSNLSLVNGDVLVASSILFSDGALEVKGNYAQEVYSSFTIEVSYSDFLVSLMVRDGVSIEDGTEIKIYQWQSDLTPPLSGEFVLVQGRPDTFDVHTSTAYYNLYNRTTKDVDIFINKEEGKMYVDFSSRDTFFARYWDYLLVAAITVSLILVGIWRVFVCVKRTGYTSV